MKNYEFFYNKSMYSEFKKLRLTESKAVRADFKKQGVNPADKQRKIAFRNLKNS